MNTAMGEASYPVFGSIKWKQALYQRAGLPAAAVDISAVT